MATLEKTLRLLFLLFIFLLPWQTQLILRDVTLNGYTWEYGKVSLYISEIVLWCLLMLYGAWLTFQPRAHLTLSRIQLLLHRPAVIGYWAAIFFAIACGLSIIWAPWQSLAVARWLTVVEGIALFSFVFVFVPRSRHASLTIADIAIVWVGGAVIESVLGLYQFFSQGVFASSLLGMAWHESWRGGAIILQTATERWLRSYGSLPHPNVLGGYLTLALFWLWYLVPKATTAVRRIAYAIVAAIISVTVLFSFSRSAWIALALGGIVIISSLWRFGDRTTIKNSIKIFIPAAVALVIIGLSLTGPIITRLEGREPLEVNSIQLRLTYTEQALALISNHWLSGVGIGNYTLAVYQEINSNLPGYYYQAVHNIFLLIFAEIGIFGILIFIALCITALLTLLRAPHTMGRAGAMAAVLTIACVGMVDHYWWTHYTGSMMMWLVFAIAFQTAKLDQH